jgi:RNase P subunit RPR2
MSPRLTCDTCTQPIANGQAHIRSRSFRQVAFCSYCWAVRRILAAVQRAA